MQFQTTGPKFLAMEALGRIAQVKNERDELLAECKTLENQNSLLAYGLKAALARLTDGLRFGEMLDDALSTVQLVECVLAHADCGFDEIYLTEAA